MSFSRKTYDPKQYLDDIRRSVDVGAYSLETPKQSCQTCYPQDPRIQLSSMNIGPVRDNIGGSVCQNKALIDVDTELRIKQSRPCDPSGSSSGLVSGDTFCESKNFHPCSSDITAEDTRISNPPCTLRSTGWNVFDVLPDDPLDKIEPPFPSMVSNRIIAKDNHRPCLPKPINQSALLPSLNSDDSVYQSPYMHMSSRPGDPHIPSTFWRHCSTYKEKV